MKPFDSIATEYQNLFEGNGRKLTNMDEFNAVAAEFKETGQYTSLTPSPSKNSKYYKFWIEQSRRCIEGYHTGYDYIPGYYYHYLNFSPIHKTLELGDTSKDLVQAERIIDFPSVWDGDYYTYHYIDEAEKSGKHGTGLKTRGRGFSFKAGSMLTRNYYHFPGSKSYAFAAEKEYLNRDGTLTKAWDVMDFIDEHTPWSKKRQVKNQDMHRRASYIEIINGVSIEKGYKSEIMGVSFKNNIDAGRGKRGKLILWEEFGNFPHGLQAWRIALNSMKQGRSVFGFMLAFGTGGSNEESFEAIEELVYSPDAYQIQPIVNTFDDARYGQPCGFFFPTILNREGCYDDNGNSDLDKAMAEVKIERAKVEKNAKNAMALTRMKAEEPITIEEAMIRTGKNIFPTNDCMMRRTTLEAYPEKYQETDYVGEFTYNSEKELIWRNNPGLIPIRKFPLKKDDDEKGAIIMFEPPIRDGKGDVPGGVYIAGTDPYDHDEAQTDSLGSTFILNLLTDRVVAEYTGRPATAEEYFENTRRLLEYYNAKTNYENNLRGMYTYFKNNKCLHLMAKQPRILKDITPTSTVNRGYGTPANIQINRYARGLCASYLQSTNVMDEDSMNTFKIRSIPLLKEFETWHPDGNFDRVSAFGMLMIYRAELNRDAIQLDQKLSTKKKSRFSGKNNVFSRNYNAGKKPKNIRFGFN